MNECVLQYMSLMAELGQGPPPTTSSVDADATSFKPARPMLAATQPVLGLPAPSVSLSVFCHKATQYTQDSIELYARLTQSSNPFGHTTNCSLAFVGQ